MISVFDIFKIGIGPSSSHTVGPMKAALQFIDALKTKGLFDQTTQIKVDLFGSLALTGKGHGTDVAILMGLSGETPEGIEPDDIPSKLATIRQQSTLLLNGQKPICFSEEHHLHFHRSEYLPRHPNSMRIHAFENDTPLYSETYYSVGGGFIVTEHEFDHPSQSSAAPAPFQFETAEELLTLCRTQRLSISELMMRNETTWQPESDVRIKLLRIAQVMERCILKGCQTEGILPGGLGVKRRAAGLSQKLQQAGFTPLTPPMQWLNVYAIAVNEENAAGGRVVTAPTNGAAGIVPAILKFYREFCPQANDDGIVDFLLTAAAIATLYKLRASISGAEVGCQGEVGVACSMAAGAFAAVMGGTLEQIENAAEIGMEHNLGLPCDPPKGLVQIPCIERNAMGAVKAFNATHLALAGDGLHKVSLDTVIKTMFQIGGDMSSIYKETSLGGLAVNLPEC